MLTRKLALTAETGELERLIAETLAPEAGPEGLLLFRRAGDLPLSEMDAVLFAGETPRFPEKHRQLIQRLAESGTKVICLGGERRDWMTGSCDFVALPVPDSARSLELFRRELLIRVKSAYGKGGPGTDAPGFSRKLVGIGASTGGPPVLLSLLKELTPKTCGILVVQHLSDGFSSRFADYLNALCPVQVRQAQEGEPVEMGTVYLAENGCHLTVEKKRDRYVLRSRPGEKVNGFCPSADRLFDSLAEQAGADALGVVLTGMGDDGAKGLLKMRLAGSQTVAQDRESCAVYGMPFEAVRQGGAAAQLPPQQILKRIQRFSDGTDAAGKEEKKGWSH